MRPNQYVHTPNDGKVSHDGRWMREVWLNGKIVERALYADTKRGIVRVCRFPLRTDKYRKRVLTKTLRGNVEVTFK